MRFNSFIFLLFLFSTVGILWLLPPRTRRWWLLGASYVFYGSWHFPYLALLFSVATLNHFGARWIMAGPSRPRRGVWILGGNLLLLGLFKYLDWLVGNVNLIARLLGHGLNLPIPHWVLPLGISFYVFEAISYTIDVIRKRERLHGFWDFQLFIAFFPKLIAGPIMRAKELLPQVEQGKLRPSARQVGEALWLLASGLFLKLVLANDLGYWVDGAFARPYQSLSAVDVWVMAVGFGLQIYFDFSSYTRMAIGSAKLCGLELVENFNYPYSARSPVDFWNRWHMSLSRWIRDYLFFPLLGRRTSLAAMCRATLVAMTLCGLWHGAGWTFVVWGLYHGLLICGTHLATYGRARPAPAVSAQAGTANRLGGFLRGQLAAFLTFAVVSLGWIFFRSANIAQAWGLLTRAFQPWAATVRGLGGSFYAETALFTLAVWLAPYCAAGWERLSVSPGVASGNPWGMRREFGLGIVQGVAIGALLVLSLIYFYGQSQFIYFQF